MAFLVIGIFWGDQAQEIQATLTPQVYDNAAMSLTEPVAPPFTRSASVFNDNGSAAPPSANDLGHSCWMPANCGSLNRSRLQASTRLTGT